MSVKAYEWQRLTSPTDIRLLIIEPAPLDADLVIEISAFSADTWQKGDVYEALSYYCGPPLYDHSVSCNGHAISVTRNLATALRFLRRSEGAHTLWVDAVCIDQSNVEERNQQVLLMHEIYRHASKVVAWLGEELPDSEIPMSLGNHKVGFLKDEPECSPSALYLHMAKFLPTTELQSSFIFFFQRPWFARTWLLNLVAFGTLQNAIDLMAVRKRVQKDNSVDARSAYHFSRRFGATDSRDRVYGLRGIMHADERDVIRPDYHKQQDDVFRDATLSLLLHDNSLEWLSYARPLYDTVDLMPLEERLEQSHLQWHGSNTQVQRPTLPTWAVDWTFVEQAEDEQNPHARHPRQLDIPENMYNAAGGSKARFSPKINTNTISLEGRIIGSIGSCARPFQHTAGMHTDKNFPERPMELNMLMAYALCIATALQQNKGDTYEPTGEARSSAIWRTLVANRWSIPRGGVRPGKANDAMGGWINRWLKLMKAADPSQRYRWTYVAYDRFMYEQTRTHRRLTAAEQEDIFPTVIAWQSMSAGVLGRCFCAIGDKYIGLCPPAAKGGDILVVLYGANVPYVLRKVEAPLSPDYSTASTNAPTSVAVDELFQLVGEAYVHGCMDGEVLGRDSSFTDRLFHIV